MATIYKRKQRDPETGELVDGPVWWISYSESGRQKKRSLKVTQKKLAEIAKAEIDKNLERGQVGLPRQNVSTESVAADFREQVIEKASPSWKRRLNQLFGHFETYLNERRLDNLGRVTTRDIERHLTIRREQTAPKTWNEELRVMKQFFQFALDRNYVSQNPAIPITRRKSDSRTIEILTPDELELIFKHSSRQFRPVFKMLLYTGMRSGEVRFLQWKNVVLAEGKEHIKVVSTEKHPTKTRKDRVVPLCPEAVQVLKEHLQWSDGKSYVFKNRNGKPYPYAHAAWTRLLKTIERKTGIQIKKGYHVNGLHLFRHTFATNALASGIDIRTVQDWLGHSTISQTQRYLNLLPEHKMEQVKKLRIPIGRK